MRIDGKPYRTIWVAEDGWGVEIIDQTRLPHTFKIARLATLEDAVAAIKDMQVRGAPLIGATAAYGVALALRAEASQAALDAACAALLEARPTAVNLRWALDEMRAHLAPLGTQAWVDAAYRRAGEIVEEDVEICRMIGVHGQPIIEELAQNKPDGEPVNILTHCNAGWLACIEYGTATAPMYVAHDKGVKIHVWVDETRPLNQGSRLTAWELGKHGIPHTVITDNAGGHLMQHG
ncbi:MAG: s-methyl-5-thioribose-1-phosphate isomerase, partial [Sphingomonadales bacterium]|nr:s-methyl-5-thioribose-1-phosphate isomerase [Sphingomonadales bacterium]